MIMLALVAFFPLLLVVAVFIYTYWRGLRQDRKRRAAALRNIHDMLKQHHG